MLKEGKNLEQVDARNVSRLINVEKPNKKQNVNKSGIIIIGRKET